jgi:cation:H+ antiporter
MTKKQVKNTVMMAIPLALCFMLVFLRSTYGSIYLEFVIFSIALYALVKAADVFTELSVVLGGILGFSKLATGILIIAIGTSAPEVFASIGATIQERPDMVLGTIFGTIVANSLLGIGCGALAAKISLTVHKDVFGTQMSIFLAAIFLVFGSLYDGVLSNYEGAIFVIVLALYLYHVIKDSKGSDNKKQNHDSNDKNESSSIIPLVSFLIISLIALFISGDIIVSSLIEGATILEISGAKLATSILAIGTSIPEIATAIALVKQNNADSLFGEIIGSNIFGLLGILGGISLFTPLSMKIDLLVFLGISVLFMFLITNVIMNDKKINRIEGVSLISLFAVFTIQLVNL